MILNDKSIEAMAKRSREEQRRLDVHDDKHQGLHLRFTPNGVKTWTLVMRDPESRLRRFTLGGFPALGVSAAREEARLLRSKVRAGADPVRDAKMKRQAYRDSKDGIGTLSSMLDTYAQQPGGSLKSWPRADQGIRNVFRTHLDRPLANLHRKELQTTADAWKATQAASVAVRSIRTVLKWAADRELCDPSLALLKTTARAKRRDRVLSREELEVLLPVLRASERPHASAMRFMLLTLARREEAASVRWHHVRFTEPGGAIWTLSETKNGQPHVVPLSRQAVALLDERAAFGAEGLIFFTQGPTGGALTNWDRETKIIQKASGTSGWTRHDLRRTGATMLGEMGEQPHIIEAALNHVSITSPLAATYNRSRYRPEVAKALQRLADALETIASKSS